MPLSLLFDHFDRLITRPGDLPRLNQTILQLAVQGQLVPQDPTDEPASELLQRIRAEKERLLLTGQLRRDEPFPPIGEDEIPYELPKNWMWVRLPEIYHDWGQTKPDRPFTYIDVSSINNEIGLIGDELQIIAPENAPSRARKLVKKGTVIYSTVRPYLLNIAIVDRDFDPLPIVSTAFAVMHPFEGICNKFLFYYLRSKPFIDFVEAQMTGMAYPAINDTKLNLGLFPLPPLAEQKRIVAKVEALLARSQALAAELAAAEAEQSRLSRASLHHLLAAPTPADFAPRWHFVATHFDAVTPDPDSVDELKQAILQLAVQGKLVEQDSADEPAMELLKLIRAEKERRRLTGELRRDEPLPLITENDIPYELPKNWVWVRLGELCETITKGSSPKWQGVNYVDKDNGILFITSKNVGQYELILDEETYVEPKFNEIEPRSILRQNDILMNIVGASIGRTAIYNSRSVD